MSEGYVYMEIDGADGGKLIVRKSDKLGALVEVRINNETVQVTPHALLIAAQNVQED